MKFRRFVYLPLVAALLLPLIGCDQGTSDQSGSSTSSNAAVVVGSNAGVSSTQVKKDYKDLVVGFAQIGAESEWRTANTASLQDTAEELGIELKFSDAQQKQENQIKAIRAFIAQKVDVIGVSPVVETGWDTVFKEVKDAGIPLILLDRHAKVPDDMFTAFIGSDFVAEGKNSCLEMARVLNNKGNIVEIEGTVDSAPAIDRKTGFQDCLSNYPEMKLLASQSGDFTRAKGKEVMQTFLKSYNGQINALFAQNDDMALGAIQAIEEAGLRPGTDIKIVSIDGTRGAFEAMVAGKLNVTVECNPLLGSQFFETALKLANGEPVDKWVKSNEGIYRQDTAAQDLLNRKY